MAITNDRNWTALERTCLSLYGGIAIPFVYFLMAIVFLGLFRSRLGGRGEEWLAFPLVWPATVIESFYHPRIEAVGDVFGAAAAELGAVFVINFITYSLITYLSLWILAKMKRSADTTDKQSTRSSP
jgi:hypothetical protein